MTTEVQHRTAEERLGQLWESLTANRGLQHAGTRLTFIILVCVHLRWRAWELMQKLGADLSANLVDLVVVPDSRLQEQVLARFLKVFPDAGDIQAFMERAPQFAKTVFAEGAARKVYEWKDLLWIIANVPEAAAEAREYASRVSKRTVTDSALARYRVKDVPDLSGDKAEALWLKLEAMAKLKEIDRVEYTKRDEFEDLWKLFQRAPAYRERTARRLLRDFPPSGRMIGDWYSMLGMQDADYFAILTEAALEIDAEVDPDCAIVWEIACISKSLVA